MCSAGLKCDIPATVLKAYVAYHARVPDDDVPLTVTSTAATTHVVFTEPLLMPQPKRKVMKRLKPKMAQENPNLTESTYTC